MNKSRKRDRDRKSDRQAEREREDCHLPRAVFHTEAMVWSFPHTSSSHTVAGGVDGRVEELTG